MTKEQQLASEIWEDRRLVRLGLDPNESAPALWEKLDKMLEEIKRREREEDPDDEDPDTPPDQAE